MYNYKIFAISLCCTICPCNLFILYIVVCVSQSQTPILALPSFLLPLDIWNHWMKTSKRKESSVPHSRTGTKQNPVWGLSFFSISCPRGHSMAKKAAATATAGVQETKDLAQAHSLETQIWQCEAWDKNPYEHIKKCCIGMISKTCFITDYSSFKN